MATESFGALQRNEYVRYSRDIARHKGRVLVLTGTASIFRAELMKRSPRNVNRLPWNPQPVDTLSLTGTTKSPRLQDVGRKDGESERVPDYHRGHAELGRPLAPTDAGGNVGHWRTSELRNNAHNTAVLGSTVWPRLRTIALNYFLLLHAAHDSLTGRCTSFRSGPSSAQMFIIERVVTVGVGVGPLVS